MRLLFAFLLISFNLSSDTVCEYSVADGDKEFAQADFLLSKAMEAQSKAFLSRISRDEKNVLLEKSAKLFSLYFECKKSQNLVIHPSSYFLNGLNFFDLSKFEEAAQNAEQSLLIDPKYRDGGLLKARASIMLKDYPKALSALESIISFYPNDSDMLYLLGSLSLEMGNESKALLYFGSLWNAIRKREGDAKYRLQTLKTMAEILSKKGDYSRAIYYLKNYLKYKDNDYESSYFLATLYSQTGNLAESKNILLDLQKKLPHNYSIDYLLAEIYFIENKFQAYRYFNYLKQNGKLKNNSYLGALFRLMKGDYKEIKPVLEKMAEKNRIRLSLYTALAYLYKKTGETEQQIKALERAAELASVYKQYGLAVELTKEKRKAVSSKPELEEKYPKAKDYEYIGISFEELGYSNLARHYMQKAEESALNGREKNNYRLRNAILLRSAKMKRYEESDRILKEILNDEPDSPMVNFNLGYNQYLNSRYKESLPYYEKSILSDEKNSTYYYYRAMSNEKLGKVQETVADLKKTIELDPNFSGAYNFLGYLYAEQNMELPESIRLIQKAIEIEPDNPSYQDSLGWVLYRLSRYEESLHHLILAKEILEEKKEEDAAVFDHLAEVYVKLKETENAREHWNKALELYTDLKEKNRVRQRLEEIGEKK